MTFFTGGNGWNLEETMQKATAWNMPLAPAVAKTWGNFTQLPLQIDSTFYWWVLRQHLPTGGELLEMEDE